MFNTDNLTKSAKYLISGETDLWSFLRVENDRYVFRKFTIDSRRKTIKLYKSEVCLRCWESVSQPVNLNQLEAFRGL